ncbi:hypothetical protein MKZ38_002143 [Zalerion maritima]|uniref:Heterokaryon incompatibility domain-containing protein n=1 Tax=Zalerion maritima TaxID=339359 RepID=A0AAD5WSP7_9PEZI|nr:hypothetical protein MKZ38_002143 [Zalerion maritima]
MRLINTTTLQLEEFASNIPPYAILSHTWREGEEVTFRDMASSSAGEGFKKKRGWEKIVKMCETAGKRFGYVWVDTCCIDKASSAELTESINSMFAWYERSSRCYFYLEDLAPLREGEHCELDQSTLGRCRWFSRGWTLQELLAPKVTRIFDAEWNYRATVRDFSASAEGEEKNRKVAEVVSAITSIPTKVLLGQSDLRACSIAQRMSWAAQRRTTRVEDRAYSLLGIFDVNMPLIYGEGMKSFRRLQEEIIKRSNEMTIFAWAPPADISKGELGVFAPSPEAFGDCGTVVTYGNNDVHFTATNKGVLASSDMVLRTVKRTDPSTGITRVRYVLFLGLRGISHVGIFLRKIGPKLYYRDHSLQLAAFQENGPDGMGMTIPTEDYHISTPSQTSPTLYQGYRKSAIRILPDTTRCKLLGVSPRSLWDVTDRIFLRPRPHAWMGWPMVLATHFEVALADQEWEKKKMIVLCGCHPQKCFARVFEAGCYPREEWLLLKEDKIEPLTWMGLDAYAPALSQLSNSVEMPIGEKKFRITACFKKEDLGKPTASPTEVMTLKLIVEKSVDGVWVVA